METTAVRLNFGVILIGMFACLSASTSQNVVKPKIIQIPKGESKSFMFTNSRAAFYFGETGKNNIYLLQGFNVETHEFLEDYIIEINGNVLLREEAMALLFPDKLVRNYALPQVTEEVTLLDSLNILVVKLSSNEDAVISVMPVIPGSPKSLSNFVTYWLEEYKILFVAHRNHLARNSKEDYPVWIGICALPRARFSPREGTLNKAYASSFKFPTFFPGTLTFPLEANNGTAFIFFMVGDSKEELLDVRTQILKKYEINNIKKPQKKLEGVRRVSYEKLEEEE